MVKLKCPNKKCENEWDYQGKSRFYACCPDCRTTVNIEKNKIEEFSNVDEEED